MKAFYHRLLFLTLFCGMILTSCTGNTQSEVTPTPNIQPSQSVSPTEVVQKIEIEDVLQGEAVFHPVVLQLTPGLGETLTSDGHIALVFDQTMDQDLVEGAWHLQDTAGKEIQGRLTWQDNGKQLIFNALKPFESGEIYRLTLDETAASAAGITLEDAVNQQFFTATPLQVNQVFPSEDSVEVESNTQITVIFNQPVVSLGIQEEQTSLLQPLTFTPPITGQGEWINTSVYVFQPAQPLEGGTRYTVEVNDNRLDPDLTPIESYKWAFTTLRPSVEWISVDEHWVSPPTASITEVVSILPNIQVSFFQPMDIANTNRSIHLVAWDGKEIPMRYTWNKEATTLLLAPRQFLRLGGFAYELVIDADAKAQNGGSLQDEVRLRFQTISAPGIDQIYLEGRNVVVDFKSAMNPNTFDGRIRVNPPIKDLRWYYNPDQKSLFIFGFAPSTRYEIEILPGTTDNFGNAINLEAMQTVDIPSINPYAYFNLPDLSQLRVDGPQEFFVQFANIQSLDFDLFRLDEAYFLTRLSEGMKGLPQGEPVWQQHYVIDEPLDAAIKKKIDFKQGGETSLAPGYYLLGMDSQEVQYEGKGRYLDVRLLMVVSDSLNLKISEGNGLLWLTGLTSGRPTPHMPVSVFDEKQTIVAVGKTDQDGLFSFELNPEHRGTSLYASSVAEGHLAFTSQDWYSGVSSDDFGIWSTYYTSRTYDSLTTYLYTDRPLYRPDQPVYFKGVVRRDRDLAYSLPEENISQVEVVIENYEKEIFRQEYPLSDFGTFNGEFMLDKETALGTYFLTAYLVGDGVPIGSVTFNVAEYRKPEFVVAVSALPEEVALGEKVQLEVQSSYYAGGALADANVNYAMHSSPFFFMGRKDFRDYSFVDQIRPYPRQDDGQDYYRLVTEGVGKTDQDGSFSVEIPADVRSAVGSRALSLDATVTDLTGNAVSGQTQLIAHSGSFYVGVKADTYVGLAGEEQQFQLAAVDWESNPLSDQMLSAVIYKLEWYSVQKEDASGILHWEYASREIPLVRFEKLKTDSNGMTAISFTPDAGGNYFARASSLDEKGRKVQASAMMWVSGGDYISWQQNDDRTFTLVTDKESYQPGEVAELLIASPYQGEAYALVTVERGLIRSQEVLQLTDNSTIIKLPISSDMAPVVYVSVLVVKGVDAYNLYPDFKMSMAAIHVSTAEQALQVSVKADPMEAGPGDLITYDVEVVDSEGNPAQAEVSLGLTDLSVLALSQPNVPSMLDHFYQVRGLSVRTSIPITHNIEAFNALVQDSVAEGQSAGSGGGKGGGDEGVALVRQNFPDTPFWLADAVTDEEGKVSVSVTLPDTLTTWRMDSRAVTLQTQAGQNTVDILSTKPLMVRPQTPRFFVVGDELKIGTAVHNNSDQDLAVRVSLQASGLVVQSELDQEVDLPAGQQVYVTWLVSVPADAQRVDLTFRAQGGGFEDASLPTLGTLDHQGIPVYRYEVPETVSTSGALQEAGLRTETIQLPQDMQVAEGSLKITIEPSLTAGLQAGLDYLEHYPYECTEQIVSRFLPNILSYQAMKASGMQDAALEENLKTQVNLAVQRLDNAQRSDGGWGWWPGSSESHPLTSAYVLFGLWQARQADYAVDEQLLMQGQSYLLSQINRDMQDEFSRHTHRQNTLAFMIFVMAQMDQPVVSQAVQLFDHWQYLSLEAQATLATTLQKINPEDTRVETLVNYLLDKAILSASGAHWEEPERDPWNWSTDTRSTAIILDTMIRIDPQNPITANAVRWLMRHRTQGRWAGTQETAWTLMALTRWMEISGDLQADYSYGVRFNEEILHTDEVSQDTLEETRTLEVDITAFIQDELNRLTIARTDGAGNLYYSADLSVNLPVDQVKAVDQGLIISRKYFQLDDLRTPVLQAQQGETLMAELTLVVPHAAHYLLVEDMLPAGLEAVNTSLLTSEAYYGDMGLSYARGWGWWYFEHSELRDEKVVLSVEYLPAGTYTYTYLVRAAFPGKFNVIPPVAQEFYFPDVYGRGDGSQFEILP
jgi:uncharacterized protein YfaS (alpha-2-macroglobulin family)